jgi:hypothetical protein
MLSLQRVVCQAFVTANASGAPDRFASATVSATTRSPFTGLIHGEAGANIRETSLSGFLALARSGWMSSVRGVDLEDLG